MHCSLCSIRTEEVLKLRAALKNAQETNLVLKERIRLLEAGEPPEPPGGISSDVPRVPNENPTLNHDEILRRSRFYDARPAYARSS
jgi:hypothetical protein